MRLRNIEILQIKCMSTKLKERSDNCRSYITGTDENIGQKGEDRNRGFAMWYEK